ncbi:MAG: BlaI/MecI/CopY family transcriptional regulator [Muribaculaceae bacterium]|nr:BlaI/MecI/CopY family transcriptional regulator [Muribaculaceae bacterium]MDE6804372.1 BlaI/MecI/CopY family transcriptional regulator [Muribaculaceae bacterium]
MKAGRKKQVLTPKEAVIMQMLWEHGPLFVREMLQFYPEPKPHFNTIATTVRILEGKGYVNHEVLGGTHRFFAVADKNEFRTRSLADVIRDYFGNSYKSAVSALAEEEKISVSELKEIISMIESKEKDK